MAGDGVLFSQASTTNPITLPAHSSMLTGTIPPTHGVHDNHNYRLAEQNLTLAEILRDQGLRTAAFVGAFVLDARFGLDQGFETYDDDLGPRAGSTLSLSASERPAEAVTAASIEWLDGLDGDPFFLFAHYFDPHVPYQAPEPLASSFADSPYVAEIAYTDHCIGQLIDKLKRMGVYDSTLIVITSDHGESLGEHGEDTHSFFVYQSTIRVPLIVKSPTGDQGRAVDVPVSVTDIVPTVLGQLGLEAPAELHGQDLSEALSGGSAGLAGRDLYCESLYPTKFGCNALRAVIRDQWKYIHTGRPELYDLQRDPAESTNLVDEHGAIAGELAGRLRELLARAERSAGADESTALSQESTNRLQSLGYVGGGTVDESFDVDPELGDAKDFLEAYERLMEAYRLLADEEFQRAEAQSLEVLARWPKLMDAFYILGTVARLQGRSADAADWFSRYLASAAQQSDAAARGAVVRRDGELAEVHVHLGKALGELEKPDQALAQFRKALELVPDHREAYIQLTDALKEVEDAPEAIAITRRALQANPDFLVAHHRMGMLQLREENLTEAIFHLREVLRIEPRNQALREWVEELEASRSHGR